MYIQPIPHCILQILYKKIVFLEQLLFDRICVCHVYMRTRACNGLKAFSHTRARAE